MEVKGIRSTWSQLQNAAAVIYSVVVMATIIPGLPTLSNLIVIPYYLLVPGYFVTILLRTTGILDRLFYSLAWSLAILASVYSLAAIGTITDVPLELVIPALTIAIMAYDYFYR